MCPSYVQEAPDSKFYREYGYRCTKLDFCRLLLFLYEPPQPYSLILVTLSFRLLQLQHAVPTHVRTAMVYRLLRHGHSGLMYLSICLSGGLSGSGRDSGVPSSPSALANPFSSSSLLEVCTPYKHSVLFHCVNSVKPSSEAESKRRRK